MVKKISAVLLALVLCLSVVVLPTTAAGFEEDYQFADGKRIAYKLELDKANYNPGDTVTVHVYVRTDEGLELHTGSMLFGMNTALVDQTAAENVANTLRTTATGNDMFMSYYTDPATINWAWQRDVIIQRVEATNTAEENELYDEYLKVVFTRNRAGTHANAGSNTAGLPAADIASDSAPFLTFQFKLRDDIPAGTPLNIAITSGSITSTPAQTAYQSYTDGNTRPAAIPQANYDVSAAVATATVGTPVAAGPVVAKSRAQVKMTATSDTTVADAFTFRVISTITDADWDAYFANTAAGGDTSAIQRLGFVAYKGTEGFDMETAKAVAQGTPTEGYEVAWTDYVQKADDSSDAYFGARLEITSAETRSDVTYVGVVEYLDAEGQTAYAFYDAAGQALLNTNYDTIVEDYLATYPYGA